MEYKLTKPISNENPFQIIQPHWSGWGKNKITVFWWGTIKQQKKGTAHKYWMYSN